MNSRQWFFSGVAFLLQVPFFAYGAGLVPCGGTGEPACQTCYALGLINSVNSWLVGILSIAAAIMFIIAGFRIVTAQGNPSTLKSAKDMITNVAIGFMIVLAAWIGVDLLMRTLLDDSSGEIGPWNTIACVDQPTARTDPGEVSITIVQTSSRCTTAEACTTAISSCENRPSGSASQTGSPGDFLITCVSEAASGADGGGQVTPGGRGEAICAEGNQNCNTTLLQSLGLSEAQAQIMSCVAVTESGGVASICSGTGPCGTFQISRADWRRYSPSVPGCAESDFGGNLTAAQNNGSCNARVMVQMVNSSRGYQPWTGQMSGQGPWNPYARGCVNTHGNAADSTNRGF